MVQKLHTFEMSKGKPQRITHLKTHFNCTVLAVLQIFNSRLFPPGIFQQNTLYIFISDEKKEECIFFSTGKQPNQFNYIPNRRNLHVATTPCCISQNFNNLLDFLRVIEIFHSSTLVIMRSSRKYNKLNREEQGDLAPRASCFSQFVTSSARLRTLSLKSIKRILGGGYLGRAHASLLPTIR